MRDCGCPKLNVHSTFPRGTLGGAWLGPRCRAARVIQLAQEQATVQLRSDRHLHPCWGLFGGKGGALSRSIVNPGTPNEENAPSKFVRTMHRGDVFRGEMAGSGGYGDPYTREPEAVLNDVRQEKITVKHALREYGIVIDPASGKVDIKATDTYRAARLAAENGQTPANRLRSPST